MSQPQVKNRETRSVDPKPDITVLDEKWSAEDVEKFSPKLRGRNLTAALAFVAGAGFTLFGCGPFNNCGIS